MSASLLLDLSKYQKALSCITPTWEKDEASKGKLYLKHFYRFVPSE